MDALAAMRKLDAVLNVLYVQKANDLLTSKYTFKEILTTIQSTDSISIADIDSILTHLETDKIIYRSTVTSYNGNPFKESEKVENEGFVITFSGKVFKESGGYEQKEKVRISESKRLAKMEKSQKTFSRIVGWATAAIILWEMVKYFLLEHHWYLY